MAALHAEHVQSIKLALREDIPLEPRGWRSHKEINVVNVQKRLTILLAVVAGMALGTGGWFFVLRDASGAKGDSSKVAHVERREREATPAAKTVRKGRSPTSPKSANAKTTRTGRSAKEQPGKTVRRRRDWKPKQPKKKRIGDAA